MNEETNERTNEQMKLPEFDDGDLVTSNFHNFNNEPVVQGILVGIEDGQYGDQYTIEVSPGNKLSVGTYDVLKSRIFRSDVGKAIKIVLKESRKGKSGRFYKDFDVYKRHQGLILAKRERGEDIVLSYPSLLKLPSFPSPLYTHLP